MKKRFHKLPISSGKAHIQFIIIATVMSMAFFLAGGFISTVQNNPQQEPPPEANSLCCDSGNGDACQPSQTKKFTWKGDEYGLLKSDVALAEGGGHLKKAPPPDDKTSWGDDIYVNTTSETYPNGYPGLPQCKPGQDYVFGSNGCVGIPNDELIFVCKSGCGSNTGKYDAYYRARDGTPPDVIKNCDQSATNGASGGQIIVETTDSQRTNLHLKNFSVTEAPVSAKWLSPYCKPAVYLYPPQKTEVSLRLAPQGNLTYTIPQYPENGWFVTAYPDGKIEYKHNTYPYLYYEAEIPDNSYREPEKGYVIEKTNLKTTLSNLLTLLGLQDNEKSEFIKYWVAVLPESKYYFIGVIPQSELNVISPLALTPKPDTVIRVTLFFKALDTKINVINPKIITPKRHGFTVVEWGGIFKRDGKHNFSCFM